MDDKFESLWQDYNFRSRNNIPKLGFHSSDTYTIQEVKKIARSAWDAAIESTKGKRFGCHLNNPFPISNYCALDDNDDKDDCPHAQFFYSMGKPKTECPYWRQIEDK